MAKSKYESHVAPRLDTIKGWAHDGNLDCDIAARLGISEASFYKYKNEHIEFSEALKDGKEDIDYKVVNALLTAALGGNVTAQIIWLKNRRPDKWRDRPEVARENKELGGVIEMPQIGEQSDGQHTD